MVYIMRHISSQSPLRYSQFILFVRLANLHLFELMAFQDERTQNAFSYLNLPENQIRVHTCCRVQSFKTSKDFKKG